MNKIVPVFEDQQPTITVGFHFAAPKRARTCPANQPQAIAILAGHLKTFAKSVNRFPTEEEVNGMTLAVMNHLSCPEHLIDPELWRQ